MSDSLPPPDPKLESKGSWRMQQRQQQQQQQRRQAGHAWEQQQRRRGDIPQREGRGFPSLIILLVALGGIIAIVIALIRLLT